MASEERPQSAELEQYLQICLSAFMVVFRLKYIDKRTIANIAVVSRYFREGCQKLIFKRLCIEENCRAWEDPQPDVLRLLVSEPNLEVRHRLCSYIEEIQLGPDDWFPPQNRPSSTTPLHPSLLRDLAQLPNLQVLYLSWASFGWWNLQNGDLQHLQMIFSRLREIHLHQANHLPFPFCLFAWLPGLKQLDLIDVFPYSADMKKVSRDLEQNLLLVGGPPSASTFPFLNHLAISGCDAMALMIELILEDPRNDIRSLESMRLSYEDGLGLAVAGRFIQSFGRWLTQFELNIIRYYDTGGDLASTGALSALIHLTHLDVTLNVSHYGGDALDVAQGPQRLFGSFLMALPAKNQLSHLRLVYDRSIECKRVPSPVACKSAFQCLLDDLGDCLASGFIQLSVFTLDVRLSLLGEPLAPPALQPNFTNEEDAIRLSTLDLPESFASLINDKVQINIYVPNYTHVS